jgi:hypothetical protein
MIRVHRTYKRSDVTFGQLNRILASLGVSRRVSKKGPSANIYEHPDRGLITALPVYAEDERVLAAHIAAVRHLLDQFGIIDAKNFDTELQKAG